MTEVCKGIRKTTIIGLRPNPLQVKATTKQVRYQYLKTHLGCDQTLDHSGANAKVTGSKRSGRKCPHGRWGAGSQVVRGQK